MRSLYSSFVVFTLVIMLISGLLAFFLSNVYYQHFLKEQNDQKYTKIALEVADYVSEQNQLQQSLAFLATTGYQLRLFNSDGESWQFGQDFRDETMEEANIRRVLNGETFHGIAHFPSETFVTGFFANELRNSIGVPVEHEGEQYALFLRPDIKLHFSEMHYLFAWLLGFTIVFSLILEMTLAHYLIRPLSKLNHATKTVQEGDFDVKLDFKRQDEIGELATSFQDMAKQLAEAEGMRNEFISSISHDIQSPLSNIKGYTSLVEDESLSTEEMSQHLQVIRSETERLSSLTSQLLVLSSLNQMEQPRHKETFSLSEQIKLVLKGYQWKLSEKEILLQYHLSEIEFTGDRAMCMSVWDNLMSNAIKYNHQGGDIRIDLIAAEHRVLVTIEDSGMGLTELEKERMFERFYRADPSRTMEIEGAGLGLAIVKKVVDLHNGELTVRSEKGKGTSITVMLPIV
ncbi:ATP-binding protein [Alkalihalobacillus sp. 1P02AB]|uniref:ATP-binding protein n=1 Tax=Alkalihalobacillus sp. 1P02AB TaxID=3132260 RepID=UPI0039A7544C